MNCCEGMGADYYFSWKSLAVSAIVIFAVSYFLINHSITGSAVGALAFVLAAKVMQGIFFKKVETATKKAKKNAR